MRLSKRFDQEPSGIIQIGARVLVLLVTAILLPPIFINDVSHYWDVGRVVGFDTLPYRDFLWEFPPLTTLTLLLVPLGGRQHATFTPMFVALMIAFEVLSWRVIRSILVESARARAHWFWLATLVPLSSIAYSRLDWPATFFGTLALSGLLAGRTGRTVAGIVGGFAVKMWTIVYVGILIGLKRFKEAAIALGLCVLTIGAWYVFSPDGLKSFFEYRKGSAFQIESVPGSLIMLFSDHPSFFQYGALMVTDAGWGWLQPVLPALFLVVGGACVLAMWFRPVNVIAMSGALVLLLLLTSRLLSPQYLVWLAPFVVLLLRVHRGQAVAFAIATWLTLVEIALYGNVIEGDAGASFIVVARNVALVVLQVQLLRLAFSRRDNDENEDNTGVSAAAA